MGRRALDPKGSLTDVAGLRVGHHTDPRRPTGCTVILVPAGTVAGVDVRGSAPGTRELDLLSPVNAVDTVHAVVLSGGSAFGLDVASGVVSWLEERGQGLVVGASRVPIVPAAILFDLWVGDPSIRPDAAAGRLACDAASEQPVAQGNVGAGAGASVGKLYGIARAMRGGLGSASIRVGGLTVAALVVVNAVGDVIDPDRGSVIAGARSVDGLSLHDTMGALSRGDWPAALPAGTSTTLGVVATNAALNKAEATKLAQMAHDGLARTIDPGHTMADGDTIFALATGAHAPAAGLTVLGALGAQAMAVAVVRAMRSARGLRGPGLPDLPAAADLRAVRDR